MTPPTHETLPREGAAEIVERLGGRSVVLVGMPGAGKTTVGRRLGQVLGLPFVDADHEIERAAAMTIPEIFALHGEAAFRDGEKRVIARLLAEGPRVIATGGGAFMAPETRDAIARNGLSVWLKAEVETLLSRVKRRSNRPLLANGDPEGTLRALLAVREPVFAQADITVRSLDIPHDVVVNAIVDAVGARLGVDAARPAAAG